MNRSRQKEIATKRAQAIELIKQKSLTWDIELYSAYDFQLDMIIRDCCNYQPRKVGKAPYEYIELG